MTPQEYKAIEKYSHDVVFCLEKLRDELLTPIGQAAINRCIVTLTTLRDIAYLDVKKEE